MAQLEHIEAIKVERNELRGFQNCPRADLYRVGPGRTGGCDIVRGLAA